MVGEKHSFSTQPLSIRPQPLGFSRPRRGDLESVFVLVVLSLEMPVYFLRLFQERLALRESENPKELIWILCEE